MAKPQDKDVMRCVGMPMRWDVENVFKNLWNPDDDRVFPPKYFGIGWDINLHALLARTGLIERKRSGQD